MDGETLARLAYLGVLIVAVGGYLLVEYRGRLGQAARGFMAWGLIFVGVAAGYGLWTDLRTQLNPRQAVMQSGAIELPRAADGHYYLTLEINGKPLEFLVDTGATNIVLSHGDAEDLGLDLNNLVYLGSAQTANGIVRTARVTLEDVALGPIRDAALTAFVTDGDMDESLLGMDYLGRFRIEIDGDRMILSR
ncbi:MAG: TIGR02281 family clan AA aspartic protease [Pseudorhodobacter sp.]|nr:TIGR02281 family clan AA aspartic protease [Pseudorhodobacter sp.]